MGFGGGGGGGGNSDTYYSNINNDQINAANARADALQAATDAATAAQRDKFNTDLSSAVTDAETNTGAKYFTDRGLPVDQDVLNHIVDSIKNNVPDLDPTPAKYFSDEAFGTGLDTAAQATRDKANNQINTQFAPGFENTLLPDSSIDPYISSILGEQQGLAQKAIDFNKARGVLNDTGYQAAETALTGQGTSAKSTLQTIGQSVLGSDRGDLTNIKGNAVDASTGYNYGMTAPDIGGYYSQAQDKAASDLSGLEGSIRGVLGTTKLFDAPLALQAGGTIQGPIDLTTAPTAPGLGFGTTSAGTLKNRGLGSSGVF